MWVASFTFDASKALIGGLAVKYKLRFSLYPFYVQQLKDCVRISFFLLFQEEPPKSFVRDLKNNSTTVFCSHKGCFIIGQVVEPLKYAVIYNPELIHLKPWLVDGMSRKETFFVGSSKRKHLTDVADVIKAKHLGKLDYIKWEDITDFFLVSVAPKITVKQRKALELAVHGGYYDYPRKITLEDLAKQMGVSYATYQAHLRKAEQKLLPALWADKC